MGHSTDGTVGGEPAQHLDVTGLREALLADGPWRKVVVTETTGSTNDDALADPVPWSVIVAAEQTSGKGRRGRAWESPAGTSVALSLVLPAVPNNPEAGVSDIEAPGWIPLTVGLGVRDALTELLSSGGSNPHAVPEAGDASSVGDAPDTSSPARAGADLARPPRVVLKWPNDVLAGLDGEEPAKVGGILCTMTGSRGPLVVAGIGINVSVPPHLLPAPVGTAPAATSLHLLAGHPVRREEVVVSIVRHAVSRFDLWWTGGAGLQRLRRDYLEACHTLGQAIDVHLPAGEIGHGVAVGVGPDGDLAVERSTGEVEHINAGDVVHIRPRGRQT